MWDKRNEEVIKHVLKRDTQLYLVHQTQNIMSSIFLSLLLSVYKLWVPISFYFFLS